MLFKRMVIKFPDPVGLNVIKVVLHIVLSLGPDTIMNFISGKSNSIKINTIKKTPLTPLNPYTLGTGKPNYFLAKHLSVYK